MSEERQSLPLVGIIYIFLVISCVTVSTLASYKGLEPSLRDYAYLGAAIIALLLLASNITIMQNRRKGESTLPAFALFLFGLLFATASNFNYFYTNFLNVDVTQHAYSEAADGLRYDIDAAIKYMSTDINIQQAEEKRAKLSALLSNLREQCRDPQNPGCGLKARAHIDEIRQIVQVTDLALPGPSTPPDKIEQFINKYTDLATDQLSRKEDSRVRDYRQLRNKAEQQLHGFQAKRVVVESGGRDLQLGAIRQDIKNMKDLSLEIETKVNTIVPNPVRWTLPVKIEADYEIGDIVRTFQSVFTHLGNPGVAFFSLILSLFIDCIPLIYVYLLVGKQDEDTEAIEAGRKRREKIL